jgi:low affinity Fe/Cu permease
MTLCIQCAEHRDTQALHAKLDALIRVTPAAQDDLTRLDEEEPETIEKHREQEKREG